MVPTVTNLRPSTRARDAQFFRSHVMPTLGNTPRQARPHHVSLGNPDGPALAPAAIHKVVQVHDDTLMARLERHRPNGVALAS